MRKSTEMLDLMHRMGITSRTAASLTLSSPSGISIVH